MVRRSKVQNMNISKKVALVTGANKGLGFATAQMLGQLGYFVMIGARDSNRGKHAERELRSQEIKAEFVLLDVTSSEQIRSATERAEAEFGKLDVLVNNAGIAIQHGQPSTMDIDRLRETLETNFFGPFAITRAFIPLLRKASAGRIVNISSSLASLSSIGDPEWYLFDNDAAAYSISKAAINSLTVLFAKELRDTEIKVNSVDPGYVITDMTGNKGLKRPEEAAKIVVRYATLPEDGPTGGFFDENGSKPW